MSRTKEELRLKLGDMLSQCEMDSFEDAVEDGHDERAREIVLGHTCARGFTREEADVLIEDIRNTIKKDRKENPILVTVTDLMVDKSTPKFLKYAEDLVDAMKKKGAPRPVGRHDRTGLLWKRDEVLAWLKSQKPTEKA